MNAVTGLLRPAWCGQRCTRVHVVGWLGSVAFAALGLVMAGTPVAAQADLLTLVRAAPQGSWLRVNQNSIAAVWAPERLRNSWTVQGTEPSRIIGAWSSFAWDSRRSSLVIYGGGHANYSGNDVYTFNGGTLLWERSSLPSRVVATDLGGGYTYGYAADGADNAPASAHTYDNTVYLRLADRVLTFGGASWNTGDVYLKADGRGGHRATGPYLFNPGRAHPDRVGGTSGSGVDPATPGGQMWQNRDALADVPGVYKPRNFVNGFSDAGLRNGRDVVYVGGAQFGTAMDLYRYTVNDLANPALDTWELVGVNWSSVDATDGSAALDTARQWFVRTGDGAVPFLAWDVNRAGADNRDVTIVPADLSGGAPVRFSGHGIAFDQRRQHFLLWGGGGALWLLTPPVDATVLTGSGWTLQRLTVAAGEVPAAQATSGGVLGKWQYAAELDVFVGLQDELHGQVWIYKPVGWTDPAVQPPRSGPVRRSPRPAPR